MESPTRVSFRCVRVVVYRLKSLCEARRVGPITHLLRLFALDDTLVAMVRSVFVNILRVMSHGSTIVSDTAITCPGNDGNHSSWKENEWA